MYNKNKILIIEDELYICDILNFALKKENYEIRCSTSGKEGLAKVESFMPDLIILDLMLPDMSGFDICKKLKAQYSIPIIMLTARNDIVDKVLGFELGADDYITKPFDIREVIARIKNVFRRGEVHKNVEKETGETIKVNGHVWIEKGSMTVYKNGKPVKLKPKEYDLLLMFAQHKGRVFTREQLLNLVWTIDYEGDLRTVDVHVRRLRQKLDVDDASSIIETLFGVGYKMRCFD